MSLANTIADTISAEIDELKVLLATQASTETIAPPAAQTVITLEPTPVSGTGVSPLHELIAAQAAEIRSRANK